MKSPKGLVQHLLLLVVGIAIIAVLVYISGFDSLKQFEHLQPVPVVAASLATVGITGAIAGRWGILTNALAKTQVAGWLDYYHYVIISRLVGFVLPKDLMDLGGRAGALNRLHNLPLAQASACVLLDRVFDLVSIALFLPITLLYWLGWVTAWPTAALMFGIAVLAPVTLCLAYKSIAAHGIRLLNAGSRFFPQTNKRLSQVLDNISLDQSVIVKTYLLSLAKFVFTGLRFVCFALALDLPISPFIIFFGLPIGQLSYLLAFTPGGLGIFEAGWFGILSAGRIAPEPATAFIVGQRILTIMIIGILAASSQIIFTLRSRANP